MALVRPMIASEMDVKSYLNELYKYVSDPGSVLKLAAPGADRIVFYDFSALAYAFLTMGNSVAITTTTLDTIQDIRTSASPTFNDLTLDDQLAVTGRADFHGATFIDADATAGLALSRNSSGNDASISITNLHDSSGADARLSLVVAGTSSGDPYISINVTGGSPAAWAVGVDNSAGDAFVISRSSVIGTNNALSIDGASVVDHPSGIQVGSSTTIAAITTGTYTPTLTNTTNLDASTAYVCTYMRVGNVVSVSGRFDIDPTIVAAVDMGISLPIASNLAALADCAGAANPEAVATRGLAIHADVTNDRAQVVGVVADITNHGYAFTFQYRII